ncbi:MAG: hypothetical protein R2710_27215 [Acidimicrobiales bacterium]
MSALRCARRRPPRRGPVAPSADNDDATRLRSVMSFLLGLGAETAAAMADAVAERAADLLRQRHPIAGEFGPDLAACAQVAAAFPGDIGGVVALLLNHVVLAPGEALYLGSGTCTPTCKGSVSS